MAVIPRGGAAELSGPVREADRKSVAGRGETASRAHRVGVRRVRPVSRRARLWRGGTEDGMVFAVFTTAYLTVAYLLVVRMGIIRPDAMWQTVSAWLAFSGGTFEPLALSSTLPPLPTLLQLPLAWWPALRETGLSSALITALAGGLTCAVLNLIFRHLGLGRLWRTLLLVLFALNPAILYYSGNGSPEMISVLFIVSSMYCFLVWQRLESSASPPALIALTGLGFTTGLAWLTRYDVVFYAAILAGIVWSQTRNRLSSPPGRSQAALITLLAPVAFWMGAWILFMLLARYESSLLAQGSVAGVQPGHSLGSPESVAISLPLGGLLAAWAWQVFPLFAVGIGLLVFDYALCRHIPSRSLAVLALSLPAAQMLSGLLELGQGLGSPQAPVLAVPFAFIIIGMLLSRLSPLTSPKAGTGDQDRYGDVAYASTEARDSSVDHDSSQELSKRERWRRRWGAALALLALSLSTVISGITMADWAEPGPREDFLPRNAVAESPVDFRRDEREIARYLVEHAGERRVLVDELEAYPIIFFTGHPEIFVTASGLDLHSEVLSPLGQVEYVLVRLPQFSDTASSVSRSSLVLNGIVESRTVEVGAWPSSGWRLGRMLEQNTDGEVVH